MVLLVANRRVVWIGDRSAARVGFGWEMSSITLHAISRDPAAFPQPCLYCQFDSDELAEVRFVPSDDKQRTCLVAVCVVKCRDLMLLLSVYSSGSV